MQKAKLGISVGLLGAAIYLTALSGSLLGLLVLAGYVLLVEDNQWLRLSAVKAVAVYLFFTFVIQAVGYVPDVLGIISDAGNLFNAYVSVPVLNDIGTLVKDLIYLAEKIFLMVLGVKALNQGTVAVPFVDKLVVKYLYAAFTYAIHYIHIHPSSGPFQIPGRPGKASVDLHPAGKIACHAGQRSCRGAGPWAFFVL